MPIIWIPPLLQKFTNGENQIEIDGNSIRQVIEELEKRYPGIKPRICDSEGKIRTEIAVAVDGEVAQTGVRTPVDPRSEIHFLPALSGGN